VSEGRRSTPARLGLLLLNLPLPGLGLLRLGRWRQALMFFAAPLAACLLLIAYYAAAPELSFSGYVVSSALFLALLATLFLSSLVLTWPASRERTGEVRRWSRWYSLILAYVAASASLLLLASLAHSFYKPYYLPSDGMAPTLAKNDRMMAAIGSVRAPRRGEIILFRVDDWIYVKRVVALPGDRIAMRGGIVILNGTEIPQRLVGEEIAQGPSGPAKVRRLIESFPGEPRDHAIYDFGQNVLDEMAERPVADGHVFVLGDNRDMSADSRVSHAQMGVEQLPIDQIVGRPLFVTWSSKGLSGADLR
jgi:signal peptidase I